MTIVSTSHDGTLVIHPCDPLDPVELRRALVQAIRHDRPLRLVLDLAGMRELDPINVGSLAAACQLGDDHQVLVFLEHTSASLTERLVAAGVPRNRLRFPGVFPDELLGER